MLNFVSNLPICKADHPSLGLRSLIFDLLFNNEITFSILPSFEAKNKSITPSFLFSLSLKKK
jgi:hypothetical protein